MSERDDAIAVCGDGVVVSEKGKPFGAGLGILGAHVGEWLLEPTKRFFNIGPLTVVPTMDPMSGTVCASLAFAF